MGKSLPPAASIDLIDTFARRRGGDIEIVLAEPVLAHGEDGVTLWLSKGPRRVSTLTQIVHDEAKRRLVGRVPGADLTDGTWSLTLKTVGVEQPERVDAQLLVQGERPLALLWGATRQSSMLPVKRSRQPAQPTRSQRVVAVGGVALDRVLRVLPPERAASARKRVRAVVRRVLP